jgi:hypothetical protein
LLSLGRLAFELAPNIGPCLTQRTSPDFDSLTDGGGCYALDHLAWPDTGPRRLRAWRATGAIYLNQAFRGAAIVRRAKAALQTAFTPENFGEEN